MSKRLVLIDGNALFFRAYFAVPSSLRTPSGLHTGAIYGFALMFRKLLAGRYPDFAAVVFDTPKPTFRAQRYPEYKAQRPPMADDLREQIPWIHRLVQVHQVPTLSLPGYEADDLIGTLTDQALAQEIEVLIVSGDKDFAQLIGPKVRMLDSMRQLTYDAELVYKKWGVRPEQFVDYLALVGDRSDNIPGVPGIGAKTAASLLHRFGDLQTVLESTEQLKGRAQKHLREFRAQAELSYELAQIDRQVPLNVQISQLAVSAPALEPIDALYKELHFFSLLSVQEQPVMVEEVEIITQAAPLRSWLDSHPGPTALLGAYEDPGAIAGALRGLALASPDRAVYVPLSPQTRPVLEPWLGDPEQAKLGHHLRLEWTGLARHGMQLRGMAGDTALASFLADPAGALPHRLEQVAKQQLQRVLPLDKELRGSGKKRAQLLSLELGEVARFMGARALAIAQSWGPLQEQLKELGQLEMLVSELQLSAVLGAMQVRGIRVSAEHLAVLQADFAERAQSSLERVHALAGHPFNLQSPKQLAVVLFEELGLPVIKRTKTGYSTAAAVLERLAPEHEIAAEVLRYRALIKLVNTYTRVLIEALAQDGRVHCNFQQTVGVSGRLITTDPDLQRTPIRSADGRRIREAFVPEPGWTLISADYSQIELRVLAHISRDPALLESFAQGADLHRATAAAIFQVPEEQVTAEQRSTGKTVNFATLYGQGATALGQQLGVPRKQAQQMIERYFERFVGVAIWQEQTIAKAHETGMVHTLGGRRRLVSELRSRNSSERSYGERIATNTPIQGSAADLCKLAMLEIDAQLRAGGFQARMLLQIHDELLLEAPPEEVQAVTALVRAAMEQSGGLGVPLVVDIGVGESWARAH